MANRYTRITGMSDAELANTLADIEKKKHTSKVLKVREKPLEGIQKSNLIVFDRAHFERQSQELRKQKPRREEGYDGPTMSPPPRLEDIYTHRCPDCHHLVNLTNIHGYKRLELTNSYDVKEVPCPTCSPTVKRYQNGLKVSVWIKNLVHDHIFTDSCNFPDDAGDLSFTEFDVLTNVDRDAGQVMQSFAEGKINEVFLCGDTGVCKTGLAISALHEIKSSGTDCLMITMKKYLDMLREDNARSKRGEEQSHIYQIVRSIPVLLVDDLGVERITETGFAVEETQGLIADRHSLGLRTVITSNMDLDDLNQYWTMKTYANYKVQPGKRVVSRLAGWYKIVPVGGMDQRMMK